MQKRRRYLYQIIFRSNRNIFGKLTVTVDFDKSVDIHILEKYCGAEFVSCNYDAGESTYYI